MDDQIVYGARVHGVCWCWPPGQPPALPRSWALWRAGGMKPQDVAVGMRIALSSDPSMAGRVVKKQDGRVRVKFDNNDKEQWKEAAELIISAGSLQPATAASPASPPEPAPSPAPAPDGGAAQELTTARAGAKARVQAMALVESEPQQQEEPHRRIRNQNQNQDGQGSPTGLLRELFQACRTGQTDTVRQLLAIDPQLVHERKEQKRSIRSPLKKEQICALDIALAPAKGGKNVNFDIVIALAEKGADLNCHETGALYLAVAQLSSKAVVRKLLDAGADPNKVTAKGNTPLHRAVTAERQDLVEELLDEGANSQQTATGGDNKGKTAVQLALELTSVSAKAWAIVKSLDPVLAKKESEKANKAFDETELGHVISTRFQRHSDEPERNSDEPEWSCDPFLTAQNVKLVIEQRTASKVYNPNLDNCFLMGGDSHTADASWLNNWRERGLMKARDTGGACLQVVTPPGLSPMQEAEAAIAKNVGVRVVRLDFVGEEIHGEGKTSAERYANEADLMGMPAFEELVRSNRSGAKEIPLTREKLLDIALQYLPTDAPERPSVEAEHSRLKQTQPEL
eukprot:COSAG01_NODE_11465_length_1928_cov_4.188628_1_plen_569_part_01